MKGANMSRNSLSNALGFPDPVIQGDGEDQAHDPFRSRFPRKAERTIASTFGRHVRPWMNRTFSYVIVVSLCVFWSGCAVFYGPDYVKVSPEHPSVVVGATQQFKLRAFYLNPTYNEDKTGVTEWSSSNPAVATISKYGVATAIAPGEALITG